MTEKPRIVYLGEEDRLFEKIRLELFDLYEVTKGGETDGALVICECEKENIPSGAVVLGKDLPLPLPIGAVKNYLTAAKPLKLSDDRRTAIYLGRQIRLTEIEGMLLSVLLSARGSSVSREELMEQVWGRQMTDGALNVYIHYLREKLETGGEKVIVSSRTGGYAVAKKFAEENDHADTD